MAKEFVLLFVKTNRNFLSYISEEKRIDNAAIQDVLLRIQRPRNQYQNSLESYNLQITNILVECKFIGFHCSRLTKCEVEDILENGLRPLDAGLLKKKLDILINMGKIDLDEYNKRLVNKRLLDAGRSDKVFTFHEIETLKDESGLKRLFSCWGGEYFYYGNEEKKSFRDRYFNISKATILMTSHEYIDFHGNDIERKIIENFLFSDDKYRRSDIDNWHFSLVKVIRYISEDDELFEELTSCSNWTF